MVVKRYLFPLILIVSVMFFWPDRNPIVITRIARILLCSFILAPCIIAILLFKYNKWVSLFLIWLGLTTALNILFGFMSVNVASVEILFFLSLALMFYFVQTLNIEINIIIKTIVYMVIFQAALGIFQCFSGIYFPFANAIDKNVAVGFLDNTLNFGAFLAIGLPFVFSFHWLTGLFVLYAIILSGSLTSVLAGIVGVCFFYRSKKLIIAGMVLLIVFFFFYKTQLLNLSTSSIATRYNIWTESIKISLHKPLIGFGSGNYKIIMPQYMEQRHIKTMGKNELWNNPSNDYVKTVFEAGFPSLILIIGFIYTTIKRYKHLKSYQLSALSSQLKLNNLKLNNLKLKTLNMYFSSFISILVLCMGYSLFLNPTNIIWAVIVIALLNVELNRREELCCFKK